MEEIELKNSLSAYYVKSTIGAFRNREGTSQKGLRNFGIIEEKDVMQVMFYRGTDNSQFAPVLVFSGKDDEGDFTKVKSTINKDDFLELAYNIRNDDPEIYQKLNSAFKGSKLEITKSDELYFSAEDVRRNQEQILENINNKISDLYDNNPEITKQLVDKNGNTINPEKMKKLIETNPEAAAFVQKLAEAMLETSSFSSVEFLTQISKKIALNLPHKEITKAEEAVITNMVNKDFINAMTSDTEFAKEAMALMVVISKRGDQLEESKELRTNLAEQFKKKTGHSIDL
jgi:hypothetical protein